MINSIEKSNLIEKIQHFLIARSAELLTWYDEDEPIITWNQFVDVQQCGDCTSIVKAIIENFPQTKLQHGRVDYDHQGPRGWDSELVGNSKKLECGHHYWVVIDNDIVEFSKGTLQGGIDYDDVYSTDPENEKRYHKIRRTL